MPAYLTTTRRIDVLAGTPIGPGGQALNDNFLNLSARTFLLSVCDVAFGAVGDGVTNDTAAVLACLAAAEALGGHVVVFFPRGTYLLNYLPKRPNITYRGEGISSRIIWNHAGVSATPNGVLLDMVPGIVPEMGSDKGNLYAFMCVDDPAALASPSDNAVPGVIVEDLWIDGNGGTFGAMNASVNPDYSYDVVSLYATTGAIVRRCKISNAPPEIDLSAAAGNLRSSCICIMAATKWQVVDNEVPGPAAYDNIAVIGYAAHTGKLARNYVGAGKRSCIQVEYLAHHCDVVDNICIQDWNGRAANCFSRFSGATYTYAAGVGTITLTNAFASYTWASGDKFYALGGLTRGTVLTITGRTSANAITVTGGPTTPTINNVSGYQYGSGNGVVLADSSHGIYFHAATDVLVTGNRVKNTTPGTTGLSGGSAFAAFGDYDTEDLAGSGSPSRPFCRAIVANNHLETTNGAAAIKLLCPLIGAGPVVALQDVCIEGNTLVSDTGACIDLATDDFTKRSTGIRFAGNNLRTGSGNLAVFRAVDGLVWHNNACRKTSASNHGITLYDCQSPSFSGGSLIGAGGGSIPILLYPRPGGGANDLLQCENVVVRDMYIDTWQKTVCAVTTAINRYSFTNNHLENVTQPLTSFVSGATGLFMGNASPSMGVVWGNYSRDSTLQTKIRDFASGTGQVDSGTSSKGISHLLGYDATAGQWSTYTAANIQITPTSALHTATSWAISAVTNTTFTVSTYTSTGGAGNVGAHFTFRWVARAGTSA